jgi:hypothetical protein
MCKISRFHLLQLSIALKISSNQFFFSKVALNTNSHLYFGLKHYLNLYLRNKSWKPECVLSFNMGWQILVFYPKPEARDKIY